MIKITNGSQIREVTETVGKDLKTLTAMGWWLVEDVKLPEIKGGVKSVITEDLSNLDSFDLLADTTEVDLSIAETINYDEMSKPEVIELLRAKEIKFNVNDKKEKLISILKGETQNGN